VLGLRTAYGRKRCILMIGVRAGLQGLVAKGVRWNHVSNHALTVLGIAPPELYINPLVLHHFMYFRQLLMQSIRPSIDLFSHTNPF
jgi:hypothetical protein